LLTCSLSNYGSTATELANKKVTATERAERKLPACLSQPACTASPAILSSQRAPEKQLSEYPRQQHRQPASYLKVGGVRDMEGVKEKKKRRKEMENKSSYLEQLRA
jgi:hypothetical protein